MSIGVGSQSVIILDEARVVLALLLFRSGGIDADLARFSPAEGKTPREIIEHNAKIMLDICDRLVDEGLNTVPWIMINGIRANLADEDVLGAMKKAGCIRAAFGVESGNQAVLDAIKKHQRLKGYLEAGAPREYLLIKSNSNPHNFVRRCQEFGFIVKTL